MCGMSITLGIDVYFLPGLCEFIIRWVDSRFLGSVSLGTRKREPDLDSGEDAVESGWERVSINFLQS